jgi:hypothetical protein
VEKLVQYTITSQVHLQKVVHWTSIYTLKILVQLTRVPGK